MLTCNTHGYHNIENFDTGMRYLENNDSQVNSW